MVSSKHQGVSCSFTETTLDPRFNRCGFAGCNVLGPAPRPVLAQETSPTSKAAARAVDPANRRKGYMTVLQALKRRGEHGGTDEELQADTGLDGSTERPRRVDVCTDSLAAAMCAGCGARFPYRREDDPCRSCSTGKPRVRRTKRGRDAIVWVASEPVQTLDLSTDSRDLSTAKAQ